MQNVVAEDELKKLLIKLGLIYEEKPEKQTRDNELIANPGRRFTDPLRAAAILSDDKATETGKRLFDKRSINLDTGEGNHKLEINLDDFLKDVPRYPPYETAYPAVSPRQILEVNSQLINKIATTFTHDDKMFLKYVFPVIENLASVIHLLPASRSHHHALPGGAFRHSLEVADLCATGALGILRDKRIRNSDSEAYQLRIQVACIIAGLLHDAGKPISDIAVTDKKSDEEWNPHNSSLYRWLRKREATSYYITWRKDRHQQHEMFSGRVYDKVVTPAINEFLAHFGPQIQSWIFESLSHNETNKDTNPIYKVVRMADQVSVRDDTKVMSSRGSIGSPGMPVEQHIIDCMRRLMHTDRWLTNEKGSPLWVDLDGAVFLLWAKAANDIISSLEDMEIPGILRDKDSIAEILYNNDFIEENPYSDSCDCHSMYWYIQPAELAAGTSRRPTVTLAVKLADPKLLFTSKRPSSGTYIKIIESNPFGDEKGKSTEKPNAENNSTQKQKQNRKKVSEPVLADNGQDHLDINLDFNGERSQALFSGIYSESEEVIFGETSTSPNVTPSNGANSTVDSNDSSHTQKSITSSNKVVITDEENEKKRLRVAEILKFENLKFAEAYKGSPNTGNLSIVWPIQNLSEDSMLDALDVLVNENLLAVDTENPLKQIHSYDGKQYIVFDIHGDDHYGKKLVLEPEQPIASNDVPLLVTPVDDKIYKTKDDGKKVSSIVEKFSSYNEMDVTDEKSTNDDAPIVIESNQDQQKKQEIDVSDIDTSQHSNIQFSPETNILIKRIPVLKTIDTHNEDLISILGKTILSGRRTPIPGKNLSLHLSMQIEIRSSLEKAGMTTEADAIMSQLLSAAHSGKKLVRKNGDGFNFIVMETT